MVLAAESPDGNSEVRLDLILVPEEGAVDSPVAAAVDRSRWEVVPEEAQDSEERLVPEEALDFLRVEAAARVAAEGLLSEASEAVLLEELELSQDRLSDFQESQRAAHSPFQPIMASAIP